MPDGFPSGVFWLLRACTEQKMNGLMNPAAMAQKRAVHIMDWINLLAMKEWDTEYRRKDDAENERNSGADP